MTLKAVNPNSPLVRRALKRDCPLCDAVAGERCKISGGPNEGQPLTTRVVHYARLDFRKGIPDARRR